MSTSGGAADTGDAAWTAPALLNSWADLGSDAGGVYSPAGYRLDGQGFVHLRGTVKGGDTGTIDYDAGTGVYTVTNTIFVLPAGYRPESKLLLFGWCGGAAGLIEVVPSGEVIQAAPTAAAWANVSLDGLSFRAA